MRQFHTSGDPQRDRQIAIRTLVPVMLASDRFGSAMHDLRIADPTHQISLSAAPPESFALQGLGWVAGLARPCARECWPPVLGQAP